jgi:hypothetical protein
VCLIDSAVFELGDAFGEITKSDEALYHILFLVFAETDFSLVILFFICHGEKIIKEKKIKKKFKYFLVCVADSRYVVPLKNMDKRYYVL